MAGKDAKTAKDPIHADADKGHIVGTFGDYIVRKDFTRGKSPVLTITNKVGRKLSAPQTILAGFLKYISLDISKFMEMSDREQVATLSEVMGFDSKEFDADHQRIYDARRDANRDVKRLTAQLSGLECDPTAPTDEVSVRELTKELSDIEQSNSEIQTAIRERNALANELAGAKEELADLEARVRSIKADIKARASALKSAEAEIKGRDVQDTAPIYEKIAAADAINEAVRAKARRQEVADELADAEKNAAEIQAALDEVESKREAARMKARAKLPLPDPRPAVPRSSACRSPSQSA
jgi:DNA repair exonuclease SbcCD ATPase subunit